MTKPIVPIHDPEPNIEISFNSNKEHSHLDGTQGLSTTKVVPDDTLADLASEYDYCMVLKAVILNGRDLDLDEHGKLYVNILLSMGLDLFIYSCSERASAYVLIRTPLELLRAYSDKIDFPLLLDPNRLKEEAARGDEKNNISPIAIRHDPNESTINPYDYIFASYKNNQTQSQYDINDELYWRPQGQNHPFTEIIRLKLTLMLIEEKPAIGRESIKIQKFIQKGHILSFFALHSLKENISLQSHMSLRFRLPWNEPIEQLRDYFGEKIALYFVFMSHFNSWLLLPATIGFPLQSAHTLTRFTLSLYYSDKAMEWGMIGFEATDRDRADFRGKMAVSHINGRQVKHFPSRRRRSRVKQHVAVIALLVSVVMAA
eukprot:gene11583-24224_t